MRNKRFILRINDVELYFGPGSLKEHLSQVVREINTVLIVTSRSAARVSGALDDVIKVLVENNIDYTIYDKVSPNPSTGIVDDIVNYMKTNRAQCFIAIGGGSVIDTSKAASLLIGTGISTRELILGTRPIFKGLRLIVINLTHGTGSEVNKFAVLTIDGTIEKRGFIARYPDVSFDDPIYTVTLSKEQTLYTTLDAFYHAYEASTSKRTNILVQSLAEKATEIITRYLFKALEKPHDLEARTMLQFASMLAGMCIDIAGGSHLNHALEHGFSGYNPGLPHGAGLAITGPFVIYYTHKAVPEISAKLLKHIDPGIRPISEDADRAMKAVLDFQEKHGFNKRLRDYGIDEQDLRPILDFVERTIIERFVFNIPFPFTRDLLEDIAKRAI